MRFFTLAAICAAATAQTTSPPEYQKTAHDIYKELIEINTSYSTGATTPAAEVVARRLREAGFSADSIQVLGASPKKANLVVRFRGTGARKPLLLLAHLDVVEALRQDWSLDPFKLTERDGYFYGRGTGDDKAQASIWVANLMRLKNEGFRPSRDLIVALTADEEGGGPYNGVAWLLANRRDLIDAEFALNEGGWGEIRSGKRRINMVQVSEKYVATFRFEVKNKGGHSSMPVKENAIYRLARALDRLSAYDFPIRLNEVTRAYFGQLADSATGDVAVDLKAIGAGDDAAARRVAQSSPMYNAVLRTTCVATRLDGGHADNALPQTAGATVNCRVVPDENAEAVQQALKRVVADDQVTISTVNQPQAGPPSPLRPEVLNAVRNITSDLWPGVLTLPYMVMGATDGLYLRRAGIPTYGVSGIFFDAEDIRFHGRDERLSMQSFYEGQEFLYRLVKTLAE
jgi:acetylornithine deacetylase/succinyl-diaminopimelate desuccinylase-like protein